MKVLRQGVDVSYAQQNVNWSVVKNNVGFVLIRIGYGRESEQTDRQFLNNYTGCKSNNIPCGGYWYSYAESVDDAIQEAKACLENLKGKTFEYPIYYDMEESFQKEKGKEFCTSIANAFLSYVESRGYWVGLYASKNFLENYIDARTRRRYAVWLAHYRKETSYTEQFGIWQYTSEGLIDGFDNVVDVNKCFVDYPKLIRGCGLNGFKKGSK